VRDRGDADAAPFDLTALDRKIELLGAAVAADELNVELEHVARDQHEVSVAAADRKPAEAERVTAALEVGDRSDGRVGADDDAIGIILIARWRAEPEELFGPILGGRIAKQRLDRIGAPHQAEREPVARRLRV